LVNIIYQRKKQQLGLDALRPWDLDAEPEGTEPLHPFKTSDELINKSIECFTSCVFFLATALKR